MNSSTAIVDISAPVETISAAIETYQLRKVYRTGFFLDRKVESLKECTLQVYEGETFGLLGLNAIFIYVASIVLIKLLMVNQIGTGDKAKSIYESLNTQLFGWAGALNSGVLFAFATVLLWLGVSSLMYRRRGFVKI